MKRGVPAEWTLRAPRKYGHSTAKPWRAQDWKLQGGASYPWPRFLSSKNTAYRYLLLLLHSPAAPHYAYWCKFPSSNLKGWPTLNQPFQTAIYQVLKFFISIFTDCHYLWLPSTWFFSDSRENWWKPFRQPEKKAIWLSVALPQVILMCLIAHLIAHLIHLFAW